MQWTIGKKFYVGLGALLTVTLALGGTALQGINGLGTTIDRLAKVQARLLDLSHRLDTAASDIIAAERGILLRAYMKNPEVVEAYKKQYLATVETFRKNFDEVRSLAVTEEERRNVEKISTTLEGLPPSHEEFIGYVSKNDLEAAAKAYNDKVLPIAKAINAAAGSLVTVETKSMEDAGVSAAATVSRTWLLTVMAVVLALLVGAVVVYVVRSVVRTLTGMVNNLKSGAEQVTSASSQVSASAQTLSQGSTEQAASLEETSASMEEMASMTRKNAENSQQAAHMMGEVDRVVDGSNKALGDMTASMASIRESSNKVAKIIKTIDEIAFQTNILALNAAVEAARAGEAGMGFAVVADEVRNLAQRSAQAAKDTAGLIEESIAKSQEGHAKVEVVAQSITAITESVGKVKGLVTEVSEASRQQTQGIDQVSQAVAQMEKVTQSTAASAEESAAASEELNAQAEKTMAEANRLEAMVVGTRTGEAVPDAPARGGAAGPAARLLKLSPKAGPKHPPASASAEAEIPLADTGTYGKF